MLHDFKEISKKIKECLNEEHLNKNIIMIVGNGIEGDSRVIKSAISLIDNGFSVLLIGTKPGKKDYTFFEYSSIPCLLVNSIEFKVILESSSEKHHEVTAIIATRITKMLKDIKYSILYTHDFWGLDYGTEIIASSYKKSKIFWIHDIHEFVDGYKGILPEGRLKYALEVEKNHIKLPDELIIVNEKIAELIWKKYELRNVPTHILHNAPRKQIESSFNLREQIGLSQDTPLGVYVGRATKARGLDIVIPALKEIKNLHIALLSSGQVSYLDKLKEEAKKLKIEDRLHIFNYVPDNEVSSAISSSDFGISPLTRYGNTDLAIATKILEYIHADLPILVSDAIFQKEFIDENKIGLVHSAEDEDDFIDKLKKMINSEHNVFIINKNLKDKYSWEFQYESILNCINNYSQNNKIRQRGILHGFGPSAGQPHGLVKALRKNKINALAVNVVTDNKLSITSDTIYPNKSIRYSASLIKWSVDRFNIIHYHFRPIINFMQNKKYLSPSFIDFEIFKQSGKKIVFNFRGSEIRINEEFKKYNPYAWKEEEDPTYLTMDDNLKKELRERVREVADLILVPDPELQTYIPEAKILPRVIDASDYDYVGCVNEFRPLIVHAPTRRGAKGTQRVLSAIEELKEKGFQFDFELIEGLSREQTKEKLSKADIVIDQLLIGWYGVLSVEAMSLGKVTLAYLRDDIKNSIANLPIVNVNPNNLTLKLVELIENFELRKEIGLKSRKFIENYHSEDAVFNILKTYYDKLDKTEKRDYSEYFLDNAVENAFELSGLRKRVKLMESQQGANKIVSVGKKNVDTSNKTKQNLIVKRKLNVFQKTSNFFVKQTLKVFINKSKYDKLISNPNGFFNDSKKGITKTIKHFYFY